LNILRIDRRHPDKDTLVKAAELIKNDGVVVGPTETRYGLMVRADRDKALARIYDLKKRDRTTPTAVFVPSADAIDQLGRVNDSARRLTECFLPGSLTLVVRARRELGPPLVVNDRIGLRWSSSPVVAGLLETTGLFLSATSANLSGGDEPESIDDIAAVFGDGVDLYLDGGRLAGEVSTVVDCYTEEYKILRTGAVAVSAIDLCVRGK